VIHELATPVSGYISFERRPALRRGDHSAGGSSGTASV